MRVFLAVLALCLYISPAFAIDAIFLRDANAGLSDAQRLEKALGLTEERKKTPVSAADMAKQYYKACQKEPNIGVSDKTRFQICLCTYEGMKEKLSSSDIATLFQTDKDGEIARYHFKKNIYAPCMARPVQHTLTQICAENENLGGRLKYGAQVCRCLGNEMGEYAQEKAFNILHSKRNAETPYAMAAVISNIRFNEHSERALKRCVRKHEYGWR